MSDPPFVSGTLAHQTREEGGGAGVHSMRPQEVGPAASAAPGQAALSKAGLEVPPESLAEDRVACFREAGGMPFTPKLRCTTAVLPVQQERSAGGPARPPAQVVHHRQTPRGRAGQLDRFPCPQALNLFLLCSVLRGALPLSTACLSVCLSLWV